MALALKSNKNFRWIDWKGWSSAHHLWWLSLHMPILFRFGESEAEWLKFVFTGNKQKIKINKGYNKISQNKVTDNDMGWHVMLQGSSMGWRGPQSCVGDAVVALVMRLIVCDIDLMVVNDLWINITHDQPTQCCHRSTMSNVTLKHPLQIPMWMMISCCLFTNKAERTSRRVRFKWRRPWDHLLITHPPLLSVARPAPGVGKQCVPGITAKASRSVVLFTHYSINSRILYILSILRRVKPEKVCCQFR